MLLEDLLEQEKREKQERERQSTLNNEMTNANSSSLLSDQDFERLRADVLGSQGMQAQGMPAQGIPAQGLLPIQQQQPMVQNQPQQRQAFVGQNQPRPQFIQRTVAQQQHPQQQAPQPHIQGQVQSMSVSMEPTVVKKDGCSVPMFVANLQKPPSLPPDSIVTEQDRQMQIQYEQWLNTQENMLSNQRKYYETEVSKLRKSRKALNSKQRALKKSGNDLTENDTIELNKVTAEQSIVQKQLENARKQLRQHMHVISDYNNKQQASIKSNLARQQMAVSLNIFLLILFELFAMKTFSLKCVNQNAVKIKNC